MCIVAVLFSSVSKVIFWGQMHKMILKNLMLSDLTMFFKFIPGGSMIGSFAIAVDDSCTLWSWKGILLLELTQWMICLGLPTYCCNSTKTFVHWQLIDSCLIANLRFEFNCNLHSSPTKVWFAFCSNWTLVITYCISRCSKVKFSQVKLPVTNQW